ncbi:ATP synthase subunit delta [Candidatus Portiera aleyrodidarum]|uniref:ATP synthase subunit delta n=1 Tax=Candidatus Portiera aleyrodidarum TV TaxID=1297582 RepID=A0A8D3X7Q6_9GAMM|nr:ATP synthase F1 subunit delta [Candidatus Portiera aleyrodidarum]AGI27232.1 ATP synthase F1, delta subunit [Candidatus Portiera aleyrodidarum TV]CEI59222.1 ATP synthase subunit delta [Candidatus Portiera aleyrodidarum]
MKISEKVENNQPYFKAIWELSVLSKDLDEWKNRIKIIDFILTYYKKNNGFKDFICNKKIKKYLDKESLNIINLLLINNKIHIRNYILYKYEKKILKHYNILNIRIISAFILNKNQKKKIIKILSLKFQKKIFINNINIKTNTIGGLIIKIKNIIIDCSIIGRLNQLKQTLGNIL